MLQKFFGNKNISKKLKFRLKNTIIDKTLTYTSETWTLTKRDRKHIVCFLLGNSPASDLYMPTFRNTLSVPSS